MAKKNQAKPSSADVTMSNFDTSTESERYVYYDKLHFIPIEDKDEVWAAQVLAYIKRNAVHFVHPDKVLKHRKTDRGEIDVLEYKKMFDPPIPDGKGGMTSPEALYVHADWKSCPIFVHLDNILEAKIKQIPLNLVVNSSDQLTMSKKQKEKEKIIGRNLMVNFLNEFNKKLGYPPLTKFDDPFEYVEKINNGYQPPQKKKNFKLKPGTVPPQGTASLANSLKAAIDDDESMALYFEDIYKIPEETACEVGLKYYMIQENKYHNKTRNMVKDLKNANAVLMRFYTSETTGRPIIEYKDCVKVMTLPFSENDCSDMKGWYEEEEITFGEFIQKFGANLKTEQLMEVFEAHRKINGWENDSLMSYDNCSFYNRQNAKIRVGYTEFESQDMEVYVNYTQDGNQRTKQVKSDFTPNTKKYPGATRDESFYNVWYKFYYMPLLLDSKTPNYNLQRQAKYIYKFGKLQDQQREGDDFRYVKASLAGYRDFSKMSWADIMDRFMPKINFLWFKFQNEMVNAIPNGGFFAKKLVAMMAESADEAGNDNTGAALEFMRKFKQTGWGLSDPMMDELGKIIGSGSPFMEFKNSMMLAAFENLNGMMQVYNLMMQALSQSAITEGAGSKPRQNATGINATIDASEDAIFFITDPFTQVTLDLAEKFLYYFQDIVGENDSSRLQEFMDIVGEADANALKAIADIPYHNLGLSVDNAMTDAQKQLINDLAMKLASAGILQPEDVFFIASIDNVKKAYAILYLKAKAGRQALADQAQQAFNQQMQVKAADLKIAQATIDSQQQADAKNINLSKQWDLKIDELINHIKGTFQQQIKQQVGQNKADEIVTKSQVEKLNNPEQDQNNGPKPPAPAQTYPNITVQLPDGSTGNIPAHKFGDLLNKHPQAKVLQ